MMVLAGPKFAQAGDRFSDLLIEGFAASLHDRGGEIAGVADLAVEERFGRLVIGQRRFHAARQRCDAVGAFSHERQERIQSGDAA